MIGSIIGAAGDLFGGLMSNHNSRKDRAESARQFNEQMDFNKNATQYRVQDALKAGINPLAALGVSSNVSPTMHAGGSDGGAGYFSNAIRSLSNIFNRQEKESRDLDLEAKRIRNQMAREELNILRQPGIDSGNQNMEQPPVGTDEYLFRFAYDLDGNPRLMVNQDITENDSDNAGYMSSLASAYSRGYINKLTGEITNPQMRRKLASDYERATGRRLMHSEKMYVSPAELAIIAAQAVAGAAETLGNLRGR